MDISVPCAAFWRLMSDFVPEHRRSGRDKETRWALVCKAMAVMAPNVHDGAISPGQGLNRTGFSSDDRPIRINRLLRAEGSAFEDLFLSASAFLAAKAQPVDWRKFAKLALNQDEKARNSLARDFFTNPRRAEAA
jgi:hypothetical protein